MHRTLQTDLYQLTMAAGYFHRGLASTRVTCELFVRRLPARRRYLMACGVDAALEAIADLRFTDDDVAFLREVPGLREAMDDAFCDYLRAFRFRGDVWALPEGTVCFGQAPIVRVEADIIEAQLVETLMLSIVNHGVMVASKAARIVRAAAGRDVLEFGTRRTHPDAALDAARAAYLVGAAGTSNVEAGRRFGIPLSGTAAHMWTMTHDSEEAAFDNYVATFPDSSVLLVDTYDTLRGTARAARAAGTKLRGIRLDSGDLLALSKACRQILDAEGCPDARIVASGDLNEYKIAAMLAEGAPIDVFGVGTELVCSKDHPSLSGVYKVVQFEREGRVVPVAKLSEGKATYPGPHQVFRRFDGARPLGDRIGLATEAPGEDEEPLLSRRLKAGTPVAPAPGLETSRARAVAQLDALDASLHELGGEEASPYPVTISDEVRSLCDRVEEMRG